MMFFRTLEHVVQLQVTANLAYRGQREVAASWGAIRRMDPTD